MCFVRFSKRKGVADSDLYYFKDKGSIQITSKLEALGRIGVRAGGARGAAAPPNFGQLRFFEQQEKIWAKPVFKDVAMFI